MAPSLAMNLPGYLTSASPPRSPHVPPPGIFDTYFRPASATPHSFIKPTRRDLLLCLLTLSFSYLLFSNPSSDSYRPSSNSNPSRYNLPKWSLFRQSDTCSAASAAMSSSHEITYGESVASHGIGPQKRLKSSATGVGLGFSGSRQDGSELVEDEDVGAPDAISTAEEYDEDEEAESDEWESGSTILRGFQPGWTLFDRLYLYNGSFYVVTTQRSDWPALRLMTSTGLPAYDAPGNEQAREPIGNEILFITPKEAAKLWGQRVYQMDGTTWLFNDGQFIDHYYHYAAELLLGAWRTYASLDPDITPWGLTTLPPPRRIWFLHQDTHEWRDGPRFNPTITFNLFPSVSLLYPDDFADLAKSTRSHQPSAFVLDRALLADRSAAFRGPWTGPTARTLASATNVGTASRWWWEPLRRQMLRYSGVSEDIINRNLEGYGAVDPVTMINPGQVSEFKPDGIPGITNLEPLAPKGSYKPLVTYISRQGSRRRLTPESHEALVAELEKRATKVGFDLRIVRAENMTKEEQFALAAETTIMLGVHGNGLTHLMWMPATPRTTVIEMFFKGGFARDYQWTAHALGMRHYAVQHDTAFTAPNTPQVNYPEGFQGSSITVDPVVVGNIIEARLTGTL